MPKTKVTARNPKKSKKTKKVLRAPQSEDDMDLADIRLGPIDGDDEPPKAKKRGRKKKKISGGVKKLDTKRTFTVISYDGMAVNGGEKGYYRSKTPAKAASKAATKWFSSGGGDTANKVVLRLREITSGGAGKIYSYVVRRKRVAGHKVKGVEVNGEDLVLHYKNVVRAGSKISHV